LDHLPKALKEVALFLVLEAEGLDLWQIWCDLNLTTPLEQEEREYGLEQILDIEFLLFTIFIFIIVIIFILVFIIIVISIIVIITIFIILILILILFFLFISLSFTFLWFLFRLGRLQDLLELSEVKLH
jgi:hypothetical protein